MAKDFTPEWNRAKAAAATAGQKWLDEHTQPQFIVRDGFTGRAVGTMLDMCGRAYVETKLNTSFGRWIKARSKGFGGVAKWIHFGNALEGRQEMGLHEAMAYAALKSFQADGIEGLRVYSWVD